MKKRKKTMNDPFKVSRKDWGVFNPVQRVEKNKKKYTRKKKHKNTCVYAYVFKSKKNVCF